jgi:general secretion pathway protein G
MNYIKIKSKGFTFVEVMVSLVLLALLASVIIPVSDLASRQAKERELKSALLEIRKALDAYKEASDKNEIPKAYQTESGYPPNLKLLEGVPLNEVNGVKRIRRFIRKIPLDPFYKQTDVLPENTWGKRSYLSEANEPKIGEDIYDIYSLSNWK